MGEGKKGQNCPLKGTEILTDYRQGKVMAQIMLSKYLQQKSLWWFSLWCWKKNIYMKSTTSTLFLTWLQWPRAVGTSPATGRFPKSISPAWQGSPAAGRCLPPAAQQQAQSRGASLDNSTLPNTNSGPPGNHAHSATDGLANLGLCWVRRGEGPSPEHKWDLCFCSWIFWSSESSGAMGLCEGQDKLLKLGLNPNITLAPCSGVSEVRTQDLAQRSHASCIWPH